MNFWAPLFLVTAIVTIAWSARRIARAWSPELGVDRLGAQAIAAGLGLGVFLTAVGLAGRWSGFFDVGLGAAAVAGIALVIYARRLRDGSPDPSPRLTAIALATAAIAVLYTYLSIKYQMHDEHAIYGHKSMVEELRHGYYPPYAPPLPLAESRYHYGFDVLAAAFARAFNFSSDTSIDLTCVLLVIFMSWAAAAVASDNGASRSGPFAAIAIHLGAGLAAFWLAGVPGRHPRCFVQYHHPSCSVELYPTQILNVFQHPVSAGVPLMLVVILLAPRLVIADDKKNWRIAAALLLPILPALALGQFVYYGLAVLGLFSALPVWLYKASTKKSALRTAGLVLGLAAIGHAGAYALGGMLAPAEMIEPGLLLRRPVLGFPENTPPLQILRHHAINLGLGFILLPVFAFLILRKGRPRAPIHLWAFACGGILVPHLYTYTRSWDIVKFPSAASFALVMLYVVLIDGLLETWWRRLGRFLVCGTGLAAAIFIAAPLRSEHRLYDEGNFHPDVQVKKVIDWLWKNGYQKNELIFAQSNVAQELAIFGGLSVVAQDTDLYYAGVKAKILEDQRRQTALIRSHLDKSALDKLDVGWIVLSDEELNNLTPRARELLTTEPRPPWLKLAASFDFPENPARRRRIWKVQLDAEL